MDAFKLQRVVDLLVKRFEYYLVWTRRDMSRVPQCAYMCIYVSGEYQIFLENLENCEKNESLRMHEGFSAAQPRPQAI